jgi:hypothetical protein
MGTGEIVIEERLGSTGVAVALALALVLEVVVVVVVASTTSGASALVAGIVGVLVALVLCFALLMSIRVVVRVTETPAGRALVVVYGVRGLVRQIFLPEEIVSVSIRRLSPWVGGWGYRGSLKLFHWAAVVTRLGDALQVDLTGGRRFCVSVDDPAAFVAALDSASRLV